MKKLKPFYFLMLSCLILISFFVPNKYIQAAQDIFTSTSFNIVSDSNNEIITDVSDLPKADAHKAIVKIKSYSLNVDNELSLFSTGSGVIIDSKGTVLTNHHVVTLEDDFDSTEKEASYMICLTEDINNEPECKYSGELIASDKDLDVALLKIQNIDNYSNKESFSYLNLNTSETISVNDEVTVLGYPSIGGNTITITKGVLSGKENKYNKSWLKTDAVMSYGSSGGAAIDSKAGVIGITSSSHSDTLGSLGYIISANSLNSWINSNIAKNPQSSSLTTRLEDLAKKIINIKNNNEFINNEPVYKITKPEDWDFTHEDEVTLSIDKKSDDQGGIISITNVKFPYEVGTDIVESSIKRDLLFLNSMATIVKNEDVLINGYQAKKVILSIAGEQHNFYYIPVENYLLKVLYDYGENDKDKSIIDDIVNSIVLIDSGTYSEKKEYSQDNPKFNINLKNDWVLLDRNSKSHPLFITHKQNKSAFVDINIEKTDDNTKSLNNDEFLVHKKQEVKENNNITSNYDLRMEVLKEDAYYNLGNNLNDIIMLDTVDKSISTGEIIEQNRFYYIKTGDKYIVVSLAFYGDNTDTYNDILNKFNEMLSYLSLEDTELNLDNNLQERNIINNPMYDSLKGKIMLKVEDNGEAFYIHPSSKKMYYLGRPNDAFSVMREQGVGITNDNLNKIPVALSNLTGPDSDGDGLPDLFEDAVGTNPNNPDSDGDGYNDKIELESNYNPNGPSRLSLDDNFSKEQKGKIFLQVENSGEAWYVNPNDGKRYFLGRPADAFQVMRNLGLGISNNNFDELE
ncbi:MAG: trypsin-like peptidase domain-containing protein [Parcubacteria group bacterium]